MIIIKLINMKIKALVLVERQQRANVEDRLEEFVVVEVGRAAVFVQEQTSAFVLIHLVVNGPCK